MLSRLLLKITVGLMALLLVTVNSEPVLPRGRLVLERRAATSAKTSTTSHHTSTTVKLTTSNAATTSYHSVTTAGRTSTTTSRSGANVGFGVLGGATNTSSNTLHTTSATTVNNNGAVVTTVTTVSGVQVTITSTVSASTGSHTSVSQHVTSSSSTTHGPVSQSTHSTVTGTPNYLGTVNNNTTATITETRTRTNNSTVTVTGARNGTYSPGARTTSETVVNGIPRTSTTAKLTTTSTSTTLTTTTTSSTTTSTTTTTTTTTTKPPAAAATPPGTNVTYGGGQIISKEILNSSYLDLPEYSTSEQRIRRGSFVDSYMLVTDNLGVLDDIAGVQPRLSLLVRSGVIAPNENSFYPVFVRAQSVTYNTTLKIAPSKNHLQVKKASILKPETQQLKIAASMDITSIPSAKTPFLRYSVIPLHTYPCPACTPVSQIIDATTMAAATLIDSILDPQGPTPPPQTRRGWYSSDTGVGLASYCKGKQGKSGRLALGTLNTISGRWFPVSEVWSGRNASCGVVGSVNGIGDLPNAGGWSIASGSARGGVYAKEYQ
ncbi:hypothetical protein HDU76_010385 [Blyttiomyces sp. JEL0837]|nr:hypothetical protein HDU76_010385 [Blyttiomyces sp. JEL0837]